MAPPALPVPIQASRANDPMYPIKCAAGKDHPCPTRSDPAPSLHQQSVDNFSQDSFAGPISQDLERVFLANNKKFDIPLSELANVSYSQESQDVPLTTGSNQHLSGDTEMFAFPGRRGAKKSTPLRPRSHPNHGRVLVPATPSNSGSSQSQPSQQPESLSNPEMVAHRQPMDVEYDDPMGDADMDTRSEPSTEECRSEPSSSYERLLAGEPDPVEENNNAGYEATQPSTQRDAFDDVSPEDVLTGQIAEWGTESHRDIGSSSTDRREHQGPSDNPSAPSGHSSAPPRSIMSLIDPRKRWRFNKYDMKLAAPSPASVLPRSADQDQTIDSETQPSIDSNDQERVQLSAGLRPRARHEIAWPVRQQLPPSHDNMEIVPDSEPLRAEQEPHLLPSLLSAVPPSSPSKNDSQDTETTSSVPTSVIEDDEDDVPLATLAGRANPIKVPSRGKAKAPTSATSARRPLEMVTSSPVGKVLHLHSEPHSLSDSSANRRKSLRIKNLCKPISPLRCHCSLHPHPML